MINIKNKKIGVFSDLHLGLGQDNSMWHNVSLNFATWASSEFEKAGITDIIIAGDVFHNRSELSLTTIDVAKKFFKSFKEFRIYILIGNHDIFHKSDNDIHSLGMLSEWNNITVIDNEPLILTTGLDKTISCIPWGTTIQQIPIADICFGHFDIQSFYMNGYKLCGKGFTSEELFKKSQLIVSGHFHKRQERKYTNGKIVYLGSPFQHNFGEVGDERGIYIFDIKSEKFEFIENTQSPKHVKIRVSDLIAKKIVAANLKKIVPTNIIRLIIDQRIQPDIHSILTTKIQSLGPISFEYEYDEPSSTVITTDDRSDQKSFGDVGTVLEEYVDAMDFSHKDELKKYLIDMYENLTS